MTFHEFCSIHSVIDKERYDLAHHLAGMRYKRTIQFTIGANMKVIKAGLEGFI